MKSTSSVVLIILIATIFLAQAVFYALPNGGLTAKLNELKNIYQQKLVEYEQLKKLHDELSEKLSSLEGELFLLRNGIFIAGGILFALGFIVGMYHEKKRPSGSR